MNQTHAASEAPTRERRPLFLAVLLVSTSMLGLETLLPRIFAVYVGPNFVYFSISIALIGLSSGGIIGSVWDERLSQRAQAKLVLLALLLSLSTVLAIWLIQVAGSHLNDINDARYAEVLADTRARSNYVFEISRSIAAPSMLFVLAVGLLAAIPFLFAGLFLALSFRISSRSLGKVYAFDLVGAGLGCALTVVSLTWLSVTNAFILVALLSAVGALSLAISGHSCGRGHFYASGSAVLFLAVLLIWGTVSRPLFEFAIHRYAHLRSVHDSPVRELRHQWTPLGRVALLYRHWSPPLNESPRIRPKVFVGMDLGGQSLVETFSPENLQLIRHTSVFSDDVLEPIVIPGLYRHLRDYLVLLAGNGQDMLRAYAWFGDRIRLQGVELNPVVYEFGLDYAPANLRDFFSRPNVEMTIAEGRAFVERTKNNFDLIFLSYSGATFATGTGSMSWTPQFLFTREAFLAYLRKLRPGGILVDHGAGGAWGIPASLKTFAAALKEFNPQADVRRHVLCYRRRGGESADHYCIYHRDPLERDEVRNIKDILAGHDLELSYSAFTPIGIPGLVNYLDSLESSGRDWPARFQPLAQDRIHADDNPFYYFNLIRGSPDWFLVIGYVATLFSALAISLLFLMVPLAINRRKGGAQAKPAWYYYVAFAMVGCGFMLIEVGSIQKFELFLGDPTLTLVSILAVLLIWSAVGSFYSSSLFDSGRLSIRRVSLLVVCYGLGVLLFLNRLIYGLMDLPLGIKMLVVAGVLFPLGFLLGNVFPQLLRQLQPGYERFIPWGLAINGVFAVVSSNLGALLYLFFGATAVLLLGLGCYLVLGLTARAGHPGNVRSEFPE